MAEYGSAMDDALKPLEDAKKLAGSGDIEGAAKLLSKTYGLSIQQARENVSAYAQKRPAVATASPTGTWTGATSADNIEGIDRTHVEGYQTPEAQAQGTQYVAQAQQPAPGAKPPTQATEPPPSNPLPSSQFSNLPQPKPIDWNAIRQRAQRDAGLQIGNLRNQALTNFNRFQTEGRSQVDFIRAQYDPEYRKNMENTLMASRDAVQNAANRGFFSSNMATDAELRANLRGEQQRMDLKSQENAQLGQLQNRLNLSGQEFNDILSQLSGRENELVSALMDQYGNRAEDVDYRERQMSTDTTLKLLGMDQQYNQFNQGLDWDKSKWGGDLQFRQEQLRSQLADNSAQRNWQSSENSTQRDWQTGQNQSNQQWQAEQAQYDRDIRMALGSLDANTRKQLQDVELSWRGGQADLDRVDANTRFQIEMGLRDKWNTIETEKWGAEFARAGQWKDQERSDQQNAWNSFYMQSIDDKVSQAEQFRNMPDASIPPELKPWTSYNNAMRKLDELAPRIISEGANMSALHDYIKRKFGIATQGTRVGPVNTANPLEAILGGGR